MGRKVGILHILKHSCKDITFVILYFNCPLPTLWYFTIYTYVRMNTLQNALGILTGCKYNVHTETLFKTANTLRIE